ncbi:MAG: hypothetical protein EZS28_008067 [Streblomastix strix]|uniref:Uncharacterized protein n=1 Tax=Streblomastix strix TaxID=222440 RepID=A0A5J4WQQ8_9EUKA|nr:MAG: hypothetical protein EZS28_008067 [Streblomastix strix]
MEKLQKSSKTKQKARRRQRHAIFNEFEQEKRKQIKFIERLRALYPSKKTDLLVEKEKKKIEHSYKKSRIKVYFDSFFLFIIDSYPSQGIGKVALEYVLLCHESVFPVFYAWVIVLV